MVSQFFTSLVFIKFLYYTLLYACYLQVLFFGFETNIVGFKIELNFDDYNFCI